MASYMAPVVDGQLMQSNKTQNKADEEKAKRSGGNLDKEAFLKLLVAEMKYQDPLAASNNSTEYISQLATFSELEGMQNLQSTAEDLKAADLVGKTVLLNVDDQLIAGQVDFLQYENGKLKLAVGGNYYDMDDIYRIIDQTYLGAYTKAENLVAAIAALPLPENLSVNDEEALKKIRETYDSMSDYEKSFVADEVVATLEGMEKRMEELKAAAAAPAAPQEPDEDEGEDGDDEDGEDTVIPDGDNDSE